MQVKNSERKAGRLTALGLFSGSILLAWSVASDELVIGHGSRPVVAADGSGTTVVIWQADDGDDEGIFAQWFTDFAMPLGSQFRVNSTTAGSQASPDATFLATGELVVVWQSEASPKRKLYGQRYDRFAMPLGSELEVSRWGAAIEPAIGADDQGGFYVAWSASPSLNAKHYRPYARAFANDGQPLGPQERFGSKIDAVAPAIGVLPSGDFLVVWEDKHKDLRGLMLDRFAMPLGSEFQVNSASVGDQASPAVAVSPAGELVVTWERREGAVRNVYARRVDPTVAMPLGSELQVSVTPISATTEAQPDLEFDARGDAVVSWQCVQAGSSGHAEMLVRLIDRFAMPLGSELQITAANPGFQHRSSVASDDTEGFVVVWQADDPGMTSLPTIYGAAVDVVSD